MINTQFSIDPPANEPVRDYLPGSDETQRLQQALDSMASEIPEIPCVVGGRVVETGLIKEWSAPHDHSLTLCRYHGATPEVVEAAASSCLEAWKQWSETPIEVRTAIFDRAAELLAGKWRDTVNAATMLGQSKTCYQAEIDAACELIDFWRFNNYFAQEVVYRDQPQSAPGIKNYVDHRPLEGFVYAVTPFNFTSISGNLCCAPALMGNVCVWKPSHSSVLSNYYLLKVLQEAGLPDGVINFIPGPSSEVTRILLEHRDFAGLHFTGSTDVFRELWGGISNNLAKYRGYPRIVGETGGKDFIFAHPSSSVPELATAALRGAFEYQGQKCSAASRMYLPRSLWGEFKELLVEQMRSIQMGDIRDFKNFIGAVINENAYGRISGYIDHARNSSGAEVIQGGECSRDQGWFIQPTLIECEDPRTPTMEEEIFGPVLSVHVYEDSRVDETLDLCDSTSPYALTGAVFGQDRVAVERCAARLRHAAGNFYINDKPTGAVVGQQPFGGARASGTDDKAGSALNLQRWVAPRTVKENFSPPTEYRYPHMG